ncbi:fibronectin type III domain-containing protein [Plebeiibacterium sediminum]|uniref:Fibronectin type III domain-containing protein n=1 Tax=Plebeiibacterium sediminum TaxID=2992112 RepID=A0AAE3SFD4_9BACT|nr:fibronectin type III domain-containing protein [Plebeiobacterium sediminum]MCW3786962.1 fibronectin type III domain-containing protein [Plebeiobacterium sediminum]
MKQLTILFIAFLALSMSSCSKDDDTKGSTTKSYTTTDFVGIWTSNQYSIDVFVKLQNDGTGEIVDPNGDTNDITWEVGTFDVEETDANGNTNTVAYNGVIATDTDGFEYYYIVSSLSTDVDQITDVYNHIVYSKGTIIDQEEEEEEGSSIETPSAPTDFTVANIGKESVSLIFNYTGTCTGVKIYSAEKTTDLEPIVNLTEVVEGENTVEIESLTPDTEYSFYVYAYNSDDTEVVYSEETVSVTVTTNSAIANLPIERFGFHDQYGGALTIGVLVNASDLVEDQSMWIESGDVTFELYTSESKDDGYALADSNPFLLPDWNNSQIVDMNAFANEWNYVAGQVYYLKVQAKDRNGNVIGESYVQEVEYPQSNDIIPEKPTGVVLTKNGTCVDITWTVADKAVSYEVYVSTTSGMDYKTKVGDTTETSMSDCDRGTNVKMYYQVVAVSSTGNKMYSDPVSIWL